MEKLNLYERKVKVMKLSTFLVLMVISVLPSVVLFVFSAQWVNFQLDRILSDYPRVLNSLSNFNASNVISQINVLRENISRKVDETRKATNEIVQHISKVENDTYLLKILPFLVANNPNRMFLRNFYYNGNRFSLEFFEYGVETKISTPTVHALLSRQLREVSVNLVEEKSFYGEMKYFLYSVEGVR